MRKITIHEMIEDTVYSGDERLVSKALALDPYVRSLTQARNIWRDYKEEYISLLPTFKLNTNSKG